MPIDFDIGDGADALGRNQLSDALDGTYWVSGWDATLGTGDLEVDIAAGEGAINGGDVSTGSTQTVDFTGDVDATDPRKAVISVDDTGTVQKTLGTAVPAAPTDEVRFRTHDPQPPTNAPGVVVAEVWLAAGVTSLVSDDLRDRRVTNDASINATPNNPDWIEDGVFSITSSASGTYTLSDTYDAVKVVVLSSSGGNAYNLRVNGVSTDYEYIDTESDSLTGSEINDVIVCGSSNGQVLHMSGAWATDFSVHVGQPYAGFTNLAVRGNNTSATSPLSSIELLGANSTSSVTAKVYGLNE